MLTADSNASTSDDFKYKNSRKDGLQSASRFLGLACVFAYLGFVLLVPILAAGRHHTCRREKAFPERETGGGARMWTQVPERGCPLPQQQRLAPNQHCRSPLLWCRTPPCKGWN